MATNRTACSAAPASEMFQIRATRSPGNWRIRAPRPGMSKIAAFTLRSGVLWVSLAAFGGYCYAQSIRMPFHPMSAVNPAAAPVAVPAAPAPPAAASAAGALTITGLTPANAAGGPVSLTVTGTNFASGCTVQWNGTALTTTFTNATHLAATVTAAQIAAASPGSNIPVTVTCNGTTTDSRIFSVSPDGVVTLTALSSTPTSYRPVTLTATGTNFADTCVMNWEGVSIGKPSSISKTQLTAVVPDDRIKVTGTGASVPITVTCGSTTTVALAFTPWPAGVAAGTPTLTSVSPTSAELGDGDVTLTATGTNFGDGCLVNWNGAVITTYVDSATQLTATIAAARITSAGLGANVPISVACGTAPPTPGQMFSVSPANCKGLPTRLTCLNWGPGSDPKTKEKKNLNDFFNTNSQLSFFNQVKSTYNAASGSTTLSADLATLNFMNGTQWTVTTNAQVGSSGSTAIGSGTVPTLSSTSAAQAAQNMLWGGTVLVSYIYPLYAFGAGNLSTPGAWGGLLDVIGKGGVDIQNFKPSTNINVSAPPVHASGGLEGYIFINAINSAPTGSSSGFAGALFGGFSYAAAYTSHGYARDYGFGNAVGGAIGQISAGILMNGVAKISISRGFGPKQSYIDSTSLAHVYVDNFKTWSLGITYQSSGVSK